MTYETYARTETIDIDIPDLRIDGAEIWVEYEVEVAPAVRFPDGRETAPQVFAEAKIRSLKINQLQLNREQIELMLGTEVLAQCEQELLEKELSAREIM